MSGFKKTQIAVALLFITVAGKPSETWAQSKSRASQKSANESVTPQRNSAFDNAVKLAEEARISGRLDEAVHSYTEAVRIRPQWPDGWWYLGALHYEKDEYALARDAFSKLLALEPNRGIAWGMLGLCQFQTREYDRAIMSLEHGRSLGFNGNLELESVVRYHAALLYARLEQFETAYEVLRDLLRVTNESPKIIEAFGIVMLRMRFLPSEIPPTKREEVLLAGRAGANMAAGRLDEGRKAFDELTKRYPNDANVHYSSAVFMMHQDADAALKEFRRALELEPNHQPAMVQMAFEYLKRREFETALPLAEKSVELAPRMFPARNVLGRVLLELGQTARAIKELEVGVQLAPASAEMHFALARAYARAGRKEEADRENEIFKKLEEKYNQPADAAQTGSTPSANTPKPNPE